MSSTPRFFVPAAAVTGDVVTLPTEAAHHARNVLRLRIGESIVIHTGDGLALHCVLTDPGGKASTATATIQDRVTLETEPRVRVTVAQALPKTPDKIEQVLQHGTEVGAAGFVFFAARRSVARLETGDKVERRLERWQQIVRGAAEQSGRAVLPTVVWSPSAMEIARTFGDYAAALILHEGATVRLGGALRLLPESVERLLIVVGPEGGFADEEIALFTSAHASVVSLGPRVLRTETAALVALAQILYARQDA